MSLMRYVVGQFRQPHGPMGHVAGWVMSKRVSNRRRNAWTLELLQPEPGQRILEIGFGPGYAITKLLEAFPTVRVVGIDHSLAMARHARARNRQVVRSGQVDLRCISVSSLASLSGPFDRVYSSNVAQFWEDPVSVFKDIRALLGPGGRVATTYMPRHRGAGDHDAIRFGTLLLSSMEAAGFQKVSLEHGPKLPLLTVSAIGFR